jgi:DNA-binding transcriptional LysR family regulator
VKSLEQQLSTRLLHRTTRQLSLTEEGEYLYRRYCLVLAQLDASYHWLESRREQPSGKLRISVPHSIGRHLILPLMPKFKAIYPHIESEIYFDDQPRDPIAYGFDVGVRGGALPESDLVARKLLPMQFLLCATSAYIASRPQINEPSDLIAHDQIRFRMSGSGRIGDWTLVKGEESIVVAQNNALIVNNQDACCDAILTHMGIGFLEAYYSMPYIESGDLVHLLPEYHRSTKVSTYYLYYPHRENLAPKVRVFVDFLVDHLVSQ